jgi:hypothetical protein
MEPSKYDCVDLQGTSMPINIPLMSRNPFNAIDRGGDEEDSGKFVPPHLLEQVGARVCLPVVDHDQGCLWRHVDSLKLTSTIREHYGERCLVRDVWCLV